MRSRWLLLLCLPWLTGCLLMSGPRETSDRVAEGGNVKVEFVSADGSEVRTIQGADGPATLAVTVFAQAEHGQLRIEVLDPQGSQTLVLEGIPSQAVGQATVQTDAQGRFRYRVIATGAQRGGYEILFQPGG